MLRIRLARTGSKKDPHYRVVVQEQRSATGGRAVEVVGHYHPRSQPAEVHLNHERIAYWKSVGAKESATVTRLIRNNPQSAA